MRNLAFADLTHTGTVIDANSFPLGAAYVAATTKATFGGDYATRLFKYPSVLEQYLRTEHPELLAFSSYMWNEHLSLAFAAQAKAHNPALITVFGGPNYPIAPQEQEAWLRARPEVDFQIDGEAEMAFIGLMHALREYDFDFAALKTHRIALPSVHYLSGPVFVSGPLLPRTAKLDEVVPSPYLMGLMDEFFDGKLTPLVQTTRGCPYTCTFCHDGISYATKTHRFSRARIEAEFEYIASRVTVPDLVLADLNFGMFPDDIDTANTLARLKTTRLWPMNFSVAAAKMQKKRVIELSRILGDSWEVGASIQSSDETVLKNIKRSNIGVDAIVQMSTASRDHHATSYTEIIVGLPGDTKEKHFKSVFDMFDLKIQDFFCYQFILLPGTEGASDVSREKYHYQTRFRVLPRCFGAYAIYDEVLPIAEMHEVCVGNDTMPYEDYLECRWFDLSLAIKNGGVYEEFLRLVEQFGGRRVSLFERIHALSVKPGSALRFLYEDFRRTEERNFFDSREELRAFLRSPGGFEAYLSGTYGANEIFRFRALAVFENLPPLIDIVVAATRAELAAHGAIDERIEIYLEQLCQVVLAQRSAVTDLGRSYELEVNFDFLELDQAGWLADPRSVWTPAHRRIIIEHSTEHREIIEPYFRQYGRTLEDLTYFIHRGKASALYRKMTLVA